MTTQESCCERHMQEEINAAEKTGLAMWMFVCPMCGNEWQFVERLPKPNEKDIK